MADKGSDLLNMSLGEPALHTGITFMMLKGQTPAMGGAVHSSHPAVCPMLQTTSLRPSWRRSLQAAGVAKARSREARSGPTRG